MSRWDRSAPRRCSPRPIPGSSPWTLDTAETLDNALLLQVRIRRGRARLVTVAHVSPGLEAMAPCLERELYRIDWGIQKADLEVPVTITPASDVTE